MRKLVLVLCIVFAVSMFTGCRMEEIATLNSVLTGEERWPQEFAGITRSRLKKAWGMPSEITENSDIWYVDGTYVKVTYEENKVVSVNRSETLRATVIEVENAKVLVEPVEIEGGPESIDRIYISKAFLGDEGIALLTEGAILEIKYDGRVLETYPAQIRNPYEIKIVENE